MLIKQTINDISYYSSNHKNPFDIKYLAMCWIFLATKNMGTIEKMLCQTEEKEEEEKGDLFFIFFH